MDSFWKSALEAAEKAKTVAKAVSQKGMVSPNPVCICSASVPGSFCSALSMRE